MQNRRTVVIQILLFLTFSVGLLFVRGIQPHYNWDLFGYTAIMYEWDGCSPEEVHRKTYELIKENVPPERYDIITGLYSYERANTDNFEVFNSQLPYYKIRPLYNAINYIAFKSGAPFVEFTYLSSIVCYLLMLVLFLIWLNSFLRPIPAFITTLLFFLAVYYIKVMYFSTPDAFAALAVFIAFYSMIRNNNYTRAYIFLFIGQLFRSDIILYSMLVVVAVVLLKPDKNSRHLSESLFFAAFSIIAFLAVNYFSNAYAFSVTMYHTFIEPQQRPDLFEYSLSLNDYFKIVNYTYPSLFRKFFIIILLPVLMIIAGKIFKVKFNNEVIKWTLIIAGIVFLRFVVFPVIWHRFFIQFYLIDVVIVILLLKHILSGRKHLSGIRTFLFKNE